MAHSYSYQYAVHAICRVNACIHLVVNTLRPGQYGQHLAETIFEDNLLNETCFSKTQPLPKSTAVSTTDEYIRLQVGINALIYIYKQRVLMHGHQGWNVRHGLCHIYMIYVYIWVVYSFCLFCCLFIIVTTQFVALYKPCKPKPKPSTYDPPWQRSKDRYLDRSQSNKYAINMQIQTSSVSK